MDNTIIVLGLLVAAVGGGYYVVNSKKKKDSSATSAAVTSVITPTTTSPTAPSTPPVVSVVVPSAPPIDPAHVTSQAEWDAYRASLPASMLPFVSAVWTPAASTAVSTPVIADPYGDHNGSVLFGSGGYVWCGPGKKVVTLKDVAVGQKITVSVADCYEQVSVSVVDPSGVEALSFVAPAGAIDKEFTAGAAGDYSLTWNASVRGTLRFIRSTV